jgi:hypothetical protein
MAGVKKKDQTLVPFTNAQDQTPKVEIDIREIVIGQWADYYPPPSNKKGPA